MSEETKEKNERVDKPVLTNVMKLEGLKHKETVKIRVFSLQLDAYLEGDITWRRRTLEDLANKTSAIDAITKGNRLLLDSDSLFVNALAELSTVVEEFPSWWSVMVNDYVDRNVVLSVHNEYVRWLTRPFRSEKEKRE